MAASVRIEDEAFGDERYGDLASAAGLADADHARGKMARLWRQCTIEQTHILSRETVTRVLGDRGVAAIVSARLGEEVDRGIRIRGTRGRIEWLKKLRDNGKYGSKGGRPKRNPDGFPTKPLRVSKNAKELTPPAPAPAPAPALPDPEKNLSLAGAHAIQPSTEPTPAPHPAPWGLQSPAEIAAARVIGDLALATWRRVSDARMERARALKLDGVLALPTIHPGKQPAAFDELRERIREEGDQAHAVCDHVVKVLAEQGAMEWLSEKAFLEGPWRTARAATLKPKRKPAQASPERVERVPLEDRAGADQLAEAWKVLGIEGEGA